jgi:hypothetical protein
MHQFQKYRLLRKATIEEEGPFKTKQVSFLFSAIQGFQSTSKKG